MPHTGRVERHEVKITTNASQDGTGFSAPVNGRIIGIAYVKDDYANTMDFVITTESLGQSVLSKSDVTASAIYSPRAQCQSVAGGALTYTSDSDPVTDHVYVADERIKIVVDEGGVAKSGTFVIIVAP
jgi:hypothetical protein